MKKIIVEIEYENDRITAKHVSDCMEFLKYEGGTTLLLYLPELDPAHNVKFKDVYIPKHAEKPGFMGRDAEQNAIEEKRKQWIPYYADA